MAESPQQITLADRIRGKLDISLRHMGNDVMDISEMLAGMENTITRLQILSEESKSTISTHLQTIKELKEELASLKQQPATEEEKD